MTGRKFATFLLVIFTIAAVAYYFTTPHGTDMPLIGVVDGNEVIVSPQMTGRIVTLNVDEGSTVKKGDLIAVLRLQHVRVAAQDRTEVVVVRVNRCRRDSRRLESLLELRDEAHDGNDVRHRARRGRRRNGPRR